MMTYDSWKTTDPREYEREEEEQPSELDLAYDRIIELENALEKNEQRVIWLESAVRELTKALNAVDVWGMP